MIVGALVVAFLVVQEFRDRGVEENILVTLHSVPRRSSMNGEVLLRMPLLKKADRYQVKRVLEDMELKGYLTSHLEPFPERPGMLTMIRVRLTYSGRNKARKIAAREARKRTGQ